MANVRFAALAVWMAAAATAPSGATVISLTFDDGSTDHVLAGRMLDERGLKGTFYVNSAQLGSSNWYMTRADVDALYARGHEIGGHTLSHPDLITISMSTAASEICDDRRNLVNFGYKPESFAYPFGSHNAAVKGIVRGER